MLNQGNRIDWGYDELNKSTISFIFAIKHNANLLDSKLDSRSDGANELIGESANGDLSVTVSQQGAR